MNEAMNIPSIRELEVYILEKSGEVSVFEKDLIREHYIHYTTEQLENLLDNWKYRERNKFVQAKFEVVRNILIQRRQRIHK